MPSWSASKMFVIVIFLTTNHLPLIRQKKHTPPFWYYTAETEESHNELILSLSKNLLRFLETPEGTPNPSVHLALRLSNSHNQAKELIHLNRLKNNLHNDIQRYSVHTLYILGHINSHVWYILVLCFHTHKLVPYPSLDSSLSNSQPVTGILALYTLALKSSCYDPSTVTFTVGENTVSLLTQLKTEMELEKEHITRKFCFDLLMGSLSHKKISSSSWRTLTLQGRGQSSQNVKMPWSGRHYSMSTMRYHLI